MTENATDVVRIVIDVTGMPQAMVDDIRAHVRGAVVEGDSYEYELGSGWRCFHCGEMFRTPGGAELHFGKPKSAPACVAARGWRYEIQHGPDGEADYAWVYDDKNNMVCVAKTHHAIAIVGRAALAAAKGAK